MLWGFFVLISTGSQHNYNISLRLKVGSNNFARLWQFPTTHMIVKLKLPCHVQKKTKHTKKLGFNKAYTCLYSRAQLWSPPLCLEDRERKELWPSHYPRLIKLMKKGLWLYVMSYFGFLHGREMEKENLFGVKVDIENDKLIHIVQSVFVLSPWKNLCI